MEVIRSVSPDGFSVAQIVINRDSGLSDDERHIRDIRERWERQEADARRLRGRHPAGAGRPHACRAAWLRHSGVLRRKGKGRGKPGLSLFEGTGGDCGPFWRCWRGRCCGGQGGRLRGWLQGATIKKAASQLPPTLGSVNTGPGETTEAIPLPACRSGEG